jgi:hypothetical protein
LEAIQARLAAACRWRYWLETFRPVKAALLPSSAALIRLAQIAPFPRLRSAIS